MMLSTRMQATLSSATRCLTSRSARDLFVFMLEARHVDMNRDKY